jgi:hypothetical protein
MARIALLVLPLSLLIQDPLPETAEAVRRRKIEERRIEAQESLHGLWRVQEVHLPDHSRPIERVRGNFLFCEGTMSYSIVARVPARLGEDEIVEVGTKKWSVTNAIDLELRHVFGYRRTPDRPDPNAKQPGRSGDLQAGGPVEIRTLVLSDRKVRISRGARDWILLVR